MNSRERKEFKEVILEEIESQKHQIESLLKFVKPIPPDNAIGRLTRMEAIGNRGVSQASLSSAQRKLARLETALNKIKNPEFGVCVRCSSLIPKGRMLLIPESVTCVACAQNKKDPINRF
jgi:DnaK suppressor protein